jgi:alanyl-tRNA synthetase
MKNISKKEWKELKKKARLLKDAAQAVSVEDKDLLRTIERFQKEIEEMKRKRQESKTELKQN